MVISVDQLVEIIERNFASNVKILKSQSRTPKDVLARHTLMYILRTSGGLSFNEIGNIVGRDHATVMYAVGQISAIVSSFEDVNKLIKQAKMQLPSTE